MKQRGLPNSYKNHGATGKYVGILRADVCSFCFKQRPITIDHITPQAQTRGVLPFTGFSVHHWTNLTGACRECNKKKDRKTLLVFLWLTHLKRKPK